jgi:hypothetical protein
MCRLMRAVTAGVMTQHQVLTAAHMCDCAWGH